MNNVHEIENLPSAEPLSGVPLESAGNAPTDQALLHLFSTI